MKRIRIIICIFFFSLLITGCWNYHELNDLAITTGIAIDIKDNKYIVSYMIANAKKSQGESNQQEASSVVYSGEGNSISSAYMDLNSKNSKIPYISHLEVIIISEDVAKNGVIDILDFLMRNPESRKEFFVVLSKGTSASSILETLSPLESFPSQNIANNIVSNQEDQSTIIVEEYSDFISKFLKEGIHPVLSGVEIEGDKEEGKNQSSLESTTPSSNTKIDTIGIFKEDKLIGWADSKETVGINILNNEVGSVLLESKCDNEYMAATLTNIKTSTDISFDKEIPKFKLNIVAEGALIEIDCQKNIKETSVINELADEFEKSLKKMLQDSLNLAQKKYNSDIFGFGEMLYKSNFKKWSKIKDQWDNEIFSQLDFEIDVNIALSSKGSFEQTILEAKNEK